MDGTPAPPCRLCGPAGDGSRRVADEVAEQLRWETDLAPGHVRDQRLDVCRRCPGRVGATCVECGCYVELRTAIGAKACPRGLWGATG